LLIERPNCYHRNVRAIKQLFLVLACISLSAGGARGSTNVVRGADELFWVPTLEQAMDMARVTGKPLFLMGYSLVGDGSTYTKIADDYCSGVF
jgi:hypothetical protein